MLRNSVIIVEYNCEDWSLLRTERELTEKLHEVIATKNSQGERVISIAPITSSNNDLSYTSGFVVVFEYETED